MLCAVLIAVGFTEQERARACDTLCPQVSHECAADVTCATCKGNDCGGDAASRPACCEHIGYGDGDCSEDRHCIGDLVCGSNNWYATTANSPPRRPCSHPLLPVCSCSAQFRDLDIWAAGSAEPTNCCEAPQKASGFLGGFFFGAFLVLLVGASVLAFRRGWCNQLVELGRKVMPSSLSSGSAGASAPPLASSDAYVSHTASAS